MTSRLFSYRVYYTGFSGLPTSVEIGRLVFVASLTDFVLADATFFGPNILDFFDVYLNVPPPRTFKIIAGSVATFTLSLDTDFYSPSVGNQYNLSVQQSYGSPVSLNDFDLGTNSIDIVSAADLPPTPPGIFSLLSLQNPKIDASSNVSVSSFVAAIVLLGFLVTFLVVMQVARR